MGDGEAEIEGGVEMGGTEMKLLLLDALFCVRLIRAYNIYDEGNITVKWFWEK